MTQSFTELRTYRTGQDLSERLYYPVAIGTDGRLVIPRRGQPALGVLYNAVPENEHAAVSSNDVAFIKLGADVAAMEYLAVGVDGRAVPARSSDNVIGQALESGVADDVIDFQSGFSTPTGSGGGGGGTGLANLEDSTEGVAVTGGTQGRITAEQVRILSNTVGNDGINLIGYSGQISDYSIRFPVNPFAEGEYLRVRALANGIVDLESAELVLSSLLDVSDAVPVDGDTIVRRGSTWEYTPLPTTAGTPTDLYPNLTNETFGVSVDSQLRTERVQIVADGRESGYIFLAYDDHTETYGIRLPRTAPGLGEFLRVSSSSTVDGLTVHNVTGADIEANTLTDVTVVTPADNHGLVYSETDGGWVNRIPTRLESPGGHSQIFVADFLDGGVAFVGDDSGYGLRVLGTTAALQTGVMSTDYRFSVSAAGFYISAGDEGLQTQARTTMDLGRLNDGLIVQAGTTAERPTVPAGQSITRFNTTTGHLEVGRVVSGAQDWFSITSEGSGSASGSRYQPPALLNEFLERLTITHMHTTGWRSQSDARTEDISRIFLAYVAEDRTDESVARTNNFSDLTGTWMAPAISPVRVFYEGNTYPGYDSYFFGGADDWPLTGVTEVPTATVEGNDLLLAFSIRRGAAYGFASGDSPILEIGNFANPYGSGDTPLIGYDEAGVGLYVNLGSGAGGTQRSETHREYLTTRPIDGNVARVNEQTTMGDVYIGTPDDSTSGSFTFRVDLTTFADGNDVGTATHEFAVNNVGTDQELGTIPLPRENTPARVDYVANAPGFQHGALRIRVTESTTGIAHRIRGYRDITTSWNEAEAFARERLTPGPALSDPAGYGINEQHDTHILVYLHPTLAGTTANDPQMTATIMAFDAETHTYRVDRLDLQRRRSQILTGNVVRFASPNFVYRAVQAYSVDRDRDLRDADLLDMATRFDDTLGLFTTRDADGATVAIAGLQGGTTTPGTAATATADLTDWSSTVPTDGQIPAYSESAGEYVPMDPPSGGGATDRIESGNVSVVVDSTSNSNQIRFAIGANEVIRVAQNRSFAINNNLFISADGRFAMNPGSASQPTLRFRDNGTSTGMYFVNNGDANQRALGIATNGVSRITVSGRGAEFSVPVNLDSHIAFDDLDNEPTITGTAHIYAASDGFHFVDSADNDRTIPTNIEDLANVTISNAADGQFLGVDSTGAITNVAAPSGGGGGGDEVSLETVALTGDDARPFYLHLGVGDLLASATGLAGVQRLNENNTNNGSVITNVANLPVGLSTGGSANYATRLRKYRMVFDQTPAPTNLPGTVNADGGIILPEGHWMLCASVNVLVNGGVGSGNRIFAALGVRDQNGLRHGQALYIRNNNYDSFIEENIAGLASVAAAVISDGTTPISVILLASAQNSANSINLRGAHVHGYQQLTTAQVST